MDGKHHRWQIFKGNAVCACHNNRRKLGSGKWCWSSGGMFVLLSGSSGGAARGQVALEEFWFSGNSCRALKGGSRKNQLMGNAWIVLALITRTSLLGSSGSAAHIKFLFLWNVWILLCVCWEVCTQHFQTVLGTFVTNGSISWAHRSWSLYLSWS